MNLELDSILEQSLSQMQVGKAGVESSLPSDPEMASQLEPLLLIAERLWSIPKPTLPPAAKAQMESRLLAAAAANPLLRPVGQQRKPIFMPRWGWVFSALTAILLFVFLMTAMMVNASADALPGTPFYPVKRTVEDARLWVAPARDEPQLAVPDQVVVNDDVDGRLGEDDAGGEEVRARLAELADHPHVGDIRQCGMMVGIELVGNRRGPWPFDPALRVGAGVCKHARNHGLIIRPLGDVVVLMPPLAMDEEELELLVQVTAEAILAATAR